MTITTANQVVNRYTSLTANAAVGATTITVANAATLNVVAGDLLLLVQMQGAQVNGTNTAQYGTVNSLNGAGNFELVSVASAAGNVITLNAACGLRNAYLAQGNTQVIWVPQYGTLTVSGAGSVTAPAWNGQTGGVVAIQATTVNLSVANAIKVNGLGFRGGAVDDQSDSPVTVSFDYRSTLNTRGAEKGESIAGFQATYDASFGGRYGLGAVANGGGGGSAHNGGGGGGANGNNGNTWNGFGVMSGGSGAAAWTLDPAFQANGNALTNSSGGGRGGYSASMLDANALAVGPGNASWGGDNRQDRGGRGGRPMQNDPGVRVFLGGGGGAGDGNNGAAGAGGAGGGIVLVIANAVTGTGAGSISANGADGARTLTGTPGNDAPGGGGAGGTVVLRANQVSGLLISANAGQGGNQFIGATEAEGPGGGGGGGYIAIPTGAVATVFTQPGNGGTTDSTGLNEFNHNGATGGATGQVVNYAANTPLPLCQPPSADLVITKSDGVSQVTSGTSTTYTITASNAGPNDAANATVSDAFPASCLAPTWTCTGAGGGSCTASGSGAISDTVALPAGASVSYTAICPVSAFATGTLSNAATVSSAIADPASANNSATDSDNIVRPATSVVSLNRASGNPRNAPTATWTITFANPVDGLSAGNFAAVNGGLGGSIVVSPPTETSGPPSAVWNVTVSTGTGSGTLGLNLVNDAGMTHSVGGLPFVGQVFTIDRTAPSATVTVTDANLVAGESSPVSIVFNEAVTGFDTSDLAVENGSLLPLQTSDSITYTTTLTPTAAIVDASNVITLAAGGALDSAGNPNTASVSNNYAIDTRIRQISVANVSVTEGNAGTSTLSFTVSLSLPAANGGVSFNLATQDGSAVAPSDYVARTQNGATIAEGASSFPFAVQVNGDTLAEADETLLLNLSGISNATPASVGAVGTILDDDPQPTTTTITSDAPDPTVTGEAYAVNVTVAAQTSSPLGTVTISDGSASCGPVTLVAGATPNSSAGCNLSSTSAGAKTLTATYAPASAAFAASSGTAGHQVNAASTTISVVGPARSRVNQPTAFTFTLGVAAPGGGSPAGMVTLSSGASSCTVTVPTATPSCTLSFSALGARTVSAAYTPANGNHAASSSSGPGNAQTLVYAQSDLAVTKNDGVSVYRTGDLLVYTVTVRNDGPDGAANVRVRDDAPVGLGAVAWTCVGSAGAVCGAASGSGSLDVTVPSLINGAVLTYTYSGGIVGAPASIVNTAWVELPVDTSIEDPALSNNSASDTNLLDDLFKNGFEAAQVNAPAGSYRLPSWSLRSVLDGVAVAVYRLDDGAGEALRVYARLLDGQVQYAIAIRDAAGELRLADWYSYASEPSLDWTARPQSGGWMLESAEIR